MANNYTVTGNGYINIFTQQDVFRVTESVGDSVFAGNMISSGTMTVTPDSGYNVSASDFSITNLSELTTPFLDNGLESPYYKWIDNITLTDTGTAGDENNTILITVNFASGGPRGGLVLEGDFFVWLDIDGKVMINNVVPEVVVSQVIAIEDNQNGPGENGNTIPNGDAVVTLVQSEDITQNTDVNGNISEITLQGQVQAGMPAILANLSIVADDNRYFQEIPYLSFVGMSSDILSLRSPVITRDSRNRITAYNFKLRYKNNQNVKLTGAGKAYLRYKTVVIPTVTKEISKIKFGDSQVTSAGEIKDIRIYGDNDAEFDLTITKASDGSSILDTNRFKKEILSPDMGKIAAVSKKLTSTGRISGQSLYRFEQEFPAYNSLIQGTAANGALSGTKTIFSSLSNVAVGDRLMMDTIPNSTTVTVTALNPDGDNANECTLSSSITAANGDKARFYRTEDYHINIYTKPGTTLNSRIPLVRPHYTINQYNAPIFIIKTKETDASYTGPTNVYKHLGMANANPSRVKDVPRRFSIKFVCTGHTFTAVGSTSGIPTWSKTDSTVSSWSNSVPANNGGMDVDIFNIRVTGVGTTTYTVTADVLIKKWGTEDVTMILDLDTIIT